MHGSLPVIHPVQIYFFLSLNNTDYHFYLYHTYLGTESILCKLCQVFTAGCQLISHSTVTHVYFIRLQIVSFDTNSLGSVRYLFTIAFCVDVIFRTPVSSRLHITCGHPALGFATDAMHMDSVYTDILILISISQLSLPASSP